MNIYKSIGLEFCTGLISNTRKTPAAKIINYTHLVWGRTAARHRRHLHSTMASDAPLLKTTVLPVDATKLGSLTSRPSQNDILDELDIKLDPNSPDAQHLRSAAEQLRTSDIPVAFPTETVYGLGADATRSSATKGIYKAKQRPADNPLIVHFASLEQLRNLLRSPTDAPDTDPIPPIYKPLITKFWPGPLTLILPNPPHSPLAPEVTAGLSTFGARMPRHPLALALIREAAVPIAAPSANASTKPSPTAAEHVAYDLDGRIETILDGGPCDVGVESTVVDGLSSPPLVLRPGGISLEQLRECEGWERTEVGYRDVSEKGVAPRAPGMKYRHYAPKATVVLFESGRRAPGWGDLVGSLREGGKVGVVRTRRWVVDGKGEEGPVKLVEGKAVARANGVEKVAKGFEGMLQAVHKQHVQRSVETHEVANGDEKFTLLDIDLGGDTADIARGVFAALRDMDRLEVDAIFVEGIGEEEGDVAAAVMNRLRKAAEVKVAA